jgi:hypothetical protein
VSFFMRALPLRLPSATAIGFFRFAINDMLNIQQKFRKSLLTC